MTLRVVPEGLAAACAGVEALTSRLAAAHAGAVPLIASVVPPAGGSGVAAERGGVQPSRRSAYGAGRARRRRARSLRRRSGRVGRRLRQR